MKKILFAALFISVASLGWSQTAGSDTKKWELQLQGGLSTPVSPYFANGYPGDGAYKFHTGFNFGGALGYKITPQLSILADLELHEFRTKNFSSAPSYYYYWDTTELSLFLKYRFLTGPITPFIFGGPGLAMNEAGYQYKYANPTSDYAAELGAFDPLLQAGVGVEYEMTDDFSVFAQAAYTIDFNDGYLTDYVYGADMPTRWVPIQAGVILNL